MAGACALALGVTLGSAMGLNFTARFMFGCVMFVAVYFWVDSLIARRRRPSPPVEAPLDAEDTSHRAQND